MDELPSIGGGAARCGGLIHQQPGADGPQAFVVSSSLEEGREESGEGRGEGRAGEGGEEHP